MVDRFKDPLIVESLETKWRLVNPFSFYYTIGDYKQFTIIVPADFITDFASTPKLFYPIFPPIGIYNKATIIHDYLYSKLSQHQFNRKLCDKILLQAMEVLGVPKYKRLLMFWAVRIFGKKHFRRS